MSKRGDYHERLAINAESKAWAEHDREPWSEYEDSFLQQLYEPTLPDSEKDLMDIAEELGRTIEACRQRYYLVKRSESVTYLTRTVTHTRDRDEVTERAVVRRRPAWMDEEGLPEWYV